MKAASRERMERNVRLPLDVLAVISSFTVAGSFRLALINVVIPAGGLSVS